nr:ADP-ribosyl-(dinitrogen reductase) hydrolase [Pseudomonas viridiflava]
MQKKHNVDVAEVLQCFKNRDPAKRFLLDTRAAHKTDPGTLWFIAETNVGRRLKVCFIPPHPGNGNAVEIKSAFDPIGDEERIYKKHA